MNGRVYDPNIGRFLSADPLVQAPEYTQSFNRYAYVWNNPLKMTDPTGFEGIDPTHQPKPKKKFSQNKPNAGGSKSSRSNTDKKTSDGGWVSGDCARSTNCSVVQVSVTDDYGFNPEVDESANGGGSSGDSGGNNTGGDVGSSGPTKYTFTSDHWVGADGENRTLLVAHPSANSARMRLHFAYTPGLYPSSMLDPLVRSARELSALVPTSYDARVGAANISAQEFQAGAAWITGGSLAAVGTAALGTSALAANSNYLSREALKNSLKRAVGKSYPTKTGYMGRPQPYGPDGRYLSPAANPGVVMSPLGRFSSGFGQGLMEGAGKGTQGATPVGRAGEFGHGIGVLLGQFL